MGAGGGGGRASQSLWPALGVFTSGPHVGHTPVVCHVGLCATSCDSCPLGVPFCAQTYTHAHNRKPRWTTDIGSQVLQVTCSYKLPNSLTKRALLSECKFLSLHQNSVAPASWESSHFQPMQASQSHKTRVFERSIQWIITSYLFSEYGWFPQTVLVIWRSISILLAEGPPL